jgi:glucose/mannose-6-phosphate isomerase
MADLSDFESFRHLDPKNVLASTELFLDQCLQMLQDTSDFILPDDYSNIDNVVFSGMGGSALGAQVFYHLYKNELSVPFYINNDYTLPEFANEKTLVILSSYSGTTEETISSLNDAVKRGCKVLALTTGGELALKMQESGFPLMKFDPKNNPSNQPRLGSGYTIIGTLTAKAGVLKINQDKILADINAAKEAFPKTKEKAMEAANNLLNYIPVIVASEFLTGTAHTMRNQFNECSKTFAVYFPIPELNHHLMEGLQHPKDKKIMFLFVDSNLYSEKIQKRAQLTKEVVRKNSIESISFSPSTETNLSQALETLSFGGLTSFYLAISYGIDPSPIPWVDYFKEKLAS